MSLNYIEQSGVIHTPSPNCSLCNESVDTNNCHIKTGCEHFLHKNCFNKYIENNSNCPQYCVEFAKRYKNVVNKTRYKFKEKQCLEILPEAIKPSSSNTNKDSTSLIILEKLKKFKATSGTQMGMQLKVLRSDDSEESANESFNAYIKQHEIVH
uniref:RING-type domain-containing protein n=1 Tax=Glossina palpalis gambiensis TaxID=67801 RepID=A0A1B0BUK7_9MUSC